jgi:glutathione S-transferase
MVRLETTAGCRRTPMVLFVVEELGVGCELVVREPGWFQTTHHTAGPLLHDGDFTLLEFDAVLRHLARTRGAGTLLPTDPRALAEVDRWMELQSTSLRPAMVRLAGALAPVPDDLVAAVLRPLAALDAALAGHDYLLGGFTVADVPSVVLGRVGELGLELARFDRLAAYVARLTARPAWGRALARAAFPTQRRLP